MPISQCNRLFNHFVHVLFNNLAFSIERCVIYPYVIKCIILKKIPSYFLLQLLKFVSDVNKVKFSESW